MAVVAPAMLIAYELIYHGWRRRSVGEMSAIALTATMSALYVLGKLFGANTLAKLEGYRPEYTLDRFLQTSGIYAGDLLLTPQPLRPTMTVLFWASLIAVALLLRRKTLLFGAVFAFLAFLPLNFVPPRDGFVLYIPLVGFALYGADLIQSLLDLVRHPDYRPQLAALVFLACAVSLGYLHAGRAAEECASMLHAQGPTWTVLQELQRVHPRVQRGAKVLLTDSPIANDWDVYFIAKLYFDDPTLKAAWLRSGKPTAYGDFSGNFDHELRFNGTTLTQTK
jgi:hypothetical protein